MWEFGMWETPVKVIVVPQRIVNVVG